jgi:tetratricopeptide (TPR) repeat protein
LLLLDVWPLRRLTRATSAPRSRRVFAEKLPLFALSLAAAAVTLWAQSSGKALQGFASVSLAERAANAVLAYVRYLASLVWPVGLSPFYPRLDGETLAWFGPVGAAAALLLGISALALGLARTRPYLFVGWFWYLGTLLPVIGLISVGAHSIADRYTYLPYFGLYLAGVWGVSDLWPARGRGPPLAVATMMVLLACAMLSHQQLRHWSSSLAFCTRAVEVSPGAIAYRQLANELMNVNRPDEALPHAERAIEIDPRSAPAHHTRGAVLLIQGHTAAAGIEFFRALEIDPDFAPSLLASASVLHAQGGTPGRPISSSGSCACGRITYSNRTPSTAMRSPWIAS